MGQQQLLLIILGVMIVGVAVTVAITLFNDHLIEADRDDIQNDLALMATRAQEYYFRPLPMAGGGHSFLGLTADAAGMVERRAVNSSALATQMPFCGIADGASSYSSVNRDFTTTRRTSHVPPVSDVAVLRLLFVV